MSIFTLNPDSIRSKRVSKIEKEKAVLYLQAYSCIFYDPFVERMYSSVLRSSFISSAQIGNLSKRMINIPININKPEAETLIQYVADYWNLLFPAQLALTMPDEFSKRRNDPYDRETLVEILGFYERFRYITSAQIKYHVKPYIHDTSSIRNHIDEFGLSTQMRECAISAFESISSGLNQFTVINARKRLPAEWINHSVYNTLLTLFEKNAELSPDDNEETVKIKEKANPNIKHVPKEFMSLKSLRQQLEI